ncbi:MAG: mannose-1-phosphate guanylyltransferase/mannose-6-phosphate isomerase [Candidatus Aenigmatarchaeota archaeon]
MKVIILAGGSGTRLWPLSRYSCPKQFLKINNSKSFFQQTIERFLKAIPPKDFIILTNKDYKFHVIADLGSISPEITTNIILEPVSKNTAPSIALGVKYCLEKLGCNRKEVLFVSPSDHIIKPEDKFIEYIKRGEELAQKGYLVTFGIKPFKPETGYGYIKVKNFLKEKDYFEVEKFIEKPDFERAFQYINEGNYFWNSGIFVFKIETILEEFKEHTQEIFTLLKGSFEEMISNFDKMPNISIDYAIMEKSKRVVTIPLEIYWNDIGSWDALFEVLEKDANNNIKIGNIFEIDTKNSMIIGNKNLIVTIGIDNLLVVNTDDAILIVKKGESQKVKDVVNLLKAKKRKEALELRTIFRPWGEYIVLEEGSRYKIKRLIVKPGEKLSLQMHYHRSEHWIVIRGIAKVTIGDKELFVHENESVYVPKSTLHRLENPGKIPLEIIEVQNGEYLGEDDIIRFDDLYGRCEN